MSKVLLSDLIWMIIPIISVYYIYYRWNDDKITIPYALTRMLLQLVLIGYVLTYIFDTKEFTHIVGVLTIMLLVASFIAMRPVAKKDKNLYLLSFISISIGGIITLGFIIGAVLDLSTWYEPRYIIPLAGMIFANAMNSVSVGAERFESEYEKVKNYKIARNHAYKASLIPNINSLFAVGLVSIPGMMTGQILSGISPLVAVKYQIMVMVMILSSSGISTAIYLKLIQNSYINKALERNSLP